MNYHHITNVLTLILTNSNQINNLLSSKKWNLHIYYYAGQSQIVYGPLIVVY